MYPFTKSFQSLSSGIYYCMVFESLELPFAFEERSVYCASAADAGTDYSSSFMTAYETATNSSSTHIGQVNAIRWESRQVGCVLSLLVVGY